jgi:hypothetical protein
MLNQKNKMQDYSVPIYKEAEGTYSLIGTGFFITEALFATADHVIRDGGSHVQLDGRFVVFDTVFRHYEVIEGAESDDLAIGRLPSGLTGTSVVTLAKELPVLRAPCAIAGFRKNTDNSNAPWFHQYRCEFEHAYALRSPNRIRLQGTRLQLNDGNLHSMSGGPVTNEQEEVIGLLTGGSFRLTPYKPTPGASTLPEIILWGVSSTHIAEVLVTLTQSVEESNPSD